MADVVIDKAWSDVQPGNHIRWSTPAFVKYGVVINAAGRSLLVRIDGKDRAIPDARWYFVEGKRNPNGENHIVVVDPVTQGLAEGFTRLPVDHVFNSAAWISTEEACEYLNWDPKKLRRYIRNGVILARKDGDRWRVNREKLKAQAAKQGWV